jgi:hypothetical protein
MALFEYNGDGEARYVGIKIGTHTSNLESGKREKERDRKK